MFKKTLARYRELRAPVKSLVFLFWIYVFTGSMLGIFTQIYLYERFSNIPLNVIATAIFYTGVFVGFVGFGYLASLFRWNIKHGFAWSFGIMAISVILLLLSGTTPLAMSAMFLMGVGEGLFWITIHTFELTETKDEERDFYSSVIGSGSQILILVGPSVATLLLYLSGNILGWGNFTLLFIVAPCVYLAGFFFLGHLRDYRPERVVWDDVKHFFSDRRNQVSQAYMVATGFKHVFQLTVSPLVVLFILGTALQVGVYNTLLSVFSALALLVLAHYRTPDNRLQFFGVASILLALLTVWLGSQFTFFALVLYSIGAGILSPIMRVSSHVIDLQTMESIGRKDRDFFATMLLRDFVLWIGRVLAGLVFLSLVSFASSEQDYLVIGLYLLAGAIIATFIGAHFLVTRLKIVKAE